MQSREEDIQQINQKMNKVNEIYKDLGNLVSSQQDQIDEIEDAVADSNQNAEYGLDQLERRQVGMEMVMRRQRKRHGAIPGRRATLNFSEI
jgi:t-SNARE complex subunit (syntaxin)